MTEKAVQSNGIEIWTDAFGDPADEPVLLIAGAASQGIGLGGSLLPTTR